MDKEKRAARRQQEDATLYRILVWFCFAVVMESILMLLNRYCFHYKVSEIEGVAALLTVVGIFRFVALAGLVFGIIWAVIRKRAGKGIAFQVCFAVFFGVLALICFAVTSMGAASVRFLQILVPAVAVLALIYYLYQREFFCIAIAGGLGLLGLWLYRRAFASHLTLFYVYLAVAAVLMIVAVILARKAQKAGGLLGGHRLFSARANYTFFYLTCALALVLMVLALPLGTLFSYYAIFGMVAWLFVMAVYYAVCLM